MNEITIEDKNGTSKINEYWIRRDTICLTRKDLQQITKGGELTDKHIGAYQALMRHKFPSIGGFQSTLLQTKSPINTKPSALQIIHLRNKHWAAVHVTETEEVCVYDSSYYPCAVCARVMCLCPSICVCVCVFVCGQKTRLFTSHRSKFATKVHFAASSLNL